MAANVFTGYWTTMTLNENVTWEISSDSSGHPFPVSNPIPDWNSHVPPLTYNHPALKYDSPYDKAERRSKRLLLSLLTPVQKKQFKNYEAFGVIGSNGGRFIVLDTVLDEGSVYGIVSSGVNHYCYQPEDEDIPDYDMMLSWKMFIEASESTFRRGAIKVAHSARYDVAGQPIRKWIKSLTNEVLAEREAAVRAAPPLPLPEPEVEPSGTYGLTLSLLLGKIRGIMRA